LEEERAVARRAMLEAIYHHECCITGLYRYTCFGCYLEIKPGSTGHTVIASIKSHETIVASGQRNTGAVRNSEVSSRLANNAVIVRVHNHEDFVAI
jgi:hypothetical protein